MPPHPQTPTPGLASALAFSLLLHLALLQLAPIGSWTEARDREWGALQARLHSPVQAPRAAAQVVQPAPAQVASPLPPGAQPPRPEPATATPSTTPLRSIQPASATQPDQGDGNRNPPLPAAALLAPYYFSASELQFPAGPVRPVPLGLPEDGSSLAGTVVLLILLNAQGKPDQISVLSSDLPPGYAAAAKAGFAAGEYQPGRIGGQRLPSRMLVEVSYQPATLPRAQLSGGSALPLSPVPSAAEK